MTVFRESGGYACSAGAGTWHIAVLMVCEIQLGSGNLAMAGSQNKRLRSADGRSRP
jgi:hypothetical protein